MARHRFVRPSTGAARRRPLREGDKNDRWMHLHAGMVRFRRSLHLMWNRLQAFSVTLLRIQIVGRVLQYAVGNQPRVRRAIGQYLDVTARVMQVYAVQMRHLFQIDHDLFDIPQHELDQPRQHRPRRHLRIDRIDNDREALKMTHFKKGQLHDLFQGFRLSRFNHEIRVGTGHVNPRTNNENCYVFHPEELFLFTMTVCATGMTKEKIVDNYFGGDYARWSHGYRWMIIYLDNEFADIMGHVGLIRWLPHFQRFHDSIERYMQTDRQRIDEHGNPYTIPGIDRLPYRVFGFIDDSIEHVSTPHSGPDGDFEGAPRKALYEDAQRSVYNGWKKLHGIKVETIYLPNGISTLFGPESARENDLGTLNHSGLDDFLAILQMTTPPADRFFGFGDGIFRGLNTIKTYYRATLGVPLTAAMILLNSAFKAARITIEKNYGLSSTVFKVCENKNAHKLGQIHPYAVEQLRVVYLLTNCYICLNGTHTFDLAPPTLEQYLSGELIPL